MGYIRDINHVKKMTPSHTIVMIGTLIGIVYADNQQFNLLICNVTLDSLVLDTYTRQA